MSGASDPAIDLQVLIEDARRRLPRAHQALLQQINAQVLVAEDWPADALDLYRTVRRTPPPAAQLAGALAAWLEDVRVVAFNGELLTRGLTAAGLDRASIQHYLDDLAWHEYGHALSATRSTEDLRRDGPRLLELVPPGVRLVIDYPGSYARRQVFDEIIANLYPLMIRRANRSDQYGAPEYLHPDLYEAFCEVLPWPPTD